MVALARKTLVYEWRRFLPAILAVGFAGLLQLLQAALVLGIFGSASVYITGSSADLWAGYPGTQSVNLGRPIDAGVEMRLRMDPAVSQVEPFHWVDADWRGPNDTGGVSVFVSGIDTRAEGMARALHLETVHLAAGEIAAVVRAKVLHCIQIAIDVVDGDRLLRHFVVDDLELAGQQFRTRADVGPAADVLAHAAPPARVFTSHSKRRSSRRGMPKRSSP